MRLFGRRSSRAATVVAPPAVLGDLPCSERGCAATTGVACSYLDRRNQPCPTAWCPQHRVGVAEPLYCRRHAGVMRALDPSETRLPPDVSSRAASLVAWIAADLSARVVALLQGMRGQQEELRIQATRLVYVGRQRDRVWEHAWKLSGHRGVGHWVAVQVTEEQDDVVQLIADGSHVHHGIPPWISARREGSALGPAEDADSRERYYDELVRAIEERLVQ